MLIEGTDRAIHLNSFHNSDSYINLMQVLLEEEPRTRFYIASDEIEKLRNVSKAFPNHVINYIGEDCVLPDRFSIEGQYQTVIDFYCLSYTRYLIGSDQSTFTYEAFHMACARFGVDSVKMQLVYNRGKGARYSTE